MPTRRHRMRLLSATGLLITAAGACLVVVRAQSGPESPPRSSTCVPWSPTLLVEAVTARSQLVQRENRISGQVEPYHTATVAAEVAERILRRPIERGDRVEKGALLAALFSDSAATALAQAQSASAQATAARRQ